MCETRRYLAAVFVILYQIDKKCIFEISLFKSRIVRCETNKEQDFFPERQYYGFSKVLE